MMTHEEVLAEMEKSFSDMTPPDRQEVVVKIDGKTFYPKDVLEEVRSGSELGHRFSAAWAQSNESESVMMDALATILGMDKNDPGFLAEAKKLMASEDHFTCADPSCDLHN